MVLMALFDRATVLTVAGVMSWAALAGAQTGPPRMPAPEDPAFSQYPLIGKAAQAAADYVGALPDYICQEVIFKTAPSSLGGARIAAVVAAEVVYENGEESHRNVTIDGAPATQPPGEADEEWSTGKIGSALVDVFSPATKAGFHFQRVEGVSGTDARLYTFEVAQENSHWDVRDDSQWLTAPYKGSVWIEPATGRVLRIERETTALPKDFHFGSMQTRVEYGYVRLGSADPYLLPVHAEMQACRPRSRVTCFQNDIDFRNYRVQAQQETDATPGLPDMGQGRGLAFVAAQSDPVLRRAADAAAEYIGELPDYVCQEVISRFAPVPSSDAVLVPGTAATVGSGRMRRTDVVTADVVYERGKEDYRNVTVNGAPTTKLLEEVDGAWSKGEFGTGLIDLFNPATAARFHFEKTERMGGTDTRRYTFEVTQENSHWEISADSRKSVPAYKGTVWIEPAGGRVLRIDKTTAGLPDRFPMDTVRSKVEYGYVRLGDSKPYLLPVRAEVQACQLSRRTCYQNVIQFRNYRKFESESQIRYGEGK